MPTATEPIRKAVQTQSLRMFCLALHGAATTVGPVQSLTRRATDRDCWWGAIRKNRCLGAGFLFSHTPADNRRFPTLPSQGERPCPIANPANGDIQRRPHSNRGIASRRSGPRSRTSSSRSKPNAATLGAIRTVEDFESLDVPDRGTDQPIVGPPNGRGDANRSRRLGEPCSGPVLGSRRG